MPKCLHNLMKFYLNTDKMRKRKKIKKIRGLNPRVRWNRNKMSSKFG